MPPEELEPPEDPLPLDDPIPLDDPVPLDDPAPLDELEPDEPLLPPSADCEDEDVFEPPPQARAMEATSPITTRTGRFARWFIMRKVYARNVKGRLQTTGDA
jgi:hypothetical protein